MSDLETLLEADAQNALASKDIIREFHPIADDLFADALGLFKTIVVALDDWEATSAHSATWRAQAHARGFRRRSCSAELKPAMEIHQLRNCFSR
jgi:hypothetical protein